MKEKKKFTIEIKNRPLRKGHQSHRSGAGTHDNRPKRLRTRSTQKRQAIQDYS